MPGLYFLARWRFPNIPYIRRRQCPADFFSETVVFVGRLESPSVLPLSSVAFTFGHLECVVTMIDPKHVLLWCVGLNYLVLFVWFGASSSPMTGCMECTHAGSSSQLRRLMPFITRVYPGLSVYKVGMMSGSTWCH